MECLYFSSAIVTLWKNSEDPIVRKLCATALAAAENALQLQVVSEASVQVNGEGYVVQHENYGDACGPFCGNMLNLAFGYYYTQDAAYFEKAKELMLAYAQYEKWHGKGFKGRGELNTGHFCVGMAYGYACFGSLLTDAEREIIVQGTYKLGILPLLEDWLLPGTKIHAFDTMGHNWWPVCVSDGAFAAIIMCDALPDAEHLADLAASGLVQWFAYKGNPVNNKLASIDNGAFYEGVGYYNYTLNEYLQFAYAYEKIRGKAPFDDRAVMSAAADFFVNTAYPSSQDDYFVGFGDCDGNGFSDCVLYLLARFPELATLRWYVQNRTKHTTDSAVFRLLHYNNIYSLPVQTPSQLSVCYKNNGWAIFRDSFAKDSTMLAVKCGDSWNHSHNDAGHFILYRNGKYEIFDSACCSYANEIYRDYYVQSYSHNVVLFNGKGQDWRDHHDHIRMRGRLYHFTDEPGFRYVVADATGPMGRWFRKHLRHFVWLKDFILIYDDIQSYEPGTVSFLLHAEENSCFNMLTPCSVSEPHGYIGNDVQNCTYLSYDQPTDEGGRAKFISVLSLHDGLNPTMTEEDYGFHVQCGDTTVYINLSSDGRIMHNNCLTEMGGYFTDAIMLAEVENDIFAVNASVIRRNGEIILDSLARTTKKIKKNLQNN
ncbi:MAG: heparinase II/III family protein [Clostridia bacterium]|nr:heparinase II/III family protein [Clostridia bacterium]